jgi:hypothetical protein
MRDSVFDIIVNASKNETMTDNIDNGPASPWAYAVAIALLAAFVLCCWVAR